MLKQTINFFTMFLAATSAVSQYDIRLEIKSLPPYHPSGSDVFVAGSFNGWNPGDKNYRFQKDQKGNYYINFKLEKGLYEYKITRGAWDKGECYNDGGSMPNRTLKVNEDVTFKVDIAEWADRFPAEPRKSTATKNVHIIDTAFFIPQLNRVRRIWIYLPESYEASHKRYPVMYLQDGQNVFDDATSFAGEWGVDESMDSLGQQSRECIIVAVDNGNEKRLNEYSPYDNERFGKGEGDKYVDFLVKTLKPFIDKHYRTLKGKNDTFIAGSSLGGLISFYALVKYPGVYGGAGIFSPAFWVAPALQRDIARKGSKINSKIYFYAGKQESESMIQDMLRVFDALHKVSKSKMASIIRTDGRHTEGSWRKEFPLFYEWIMR